MRGASGQALCALHQAVVVVVDDEQGRAFVGVRDVHWRHQVFTVLGEQLGPFHGFPLVQQGRFVIEKILNLGPGQQCHRLCFLEV